MKKGSFLLAVSILILSCGRGVKEVKIGDQIWMSENLDVTVFRNGDEIPQTVGQVAWKKAIEEKTPAWCYYEDSENRGKLYGKLYNWYAVIDKRGLAPQGWHIPSETEFRKLIETAETTYRSFVSNTMKSPDFWFEVAGRKGTNETGFNALPAGYRNSMGEFEQLSYQCHFWSSTQTDSILGQAASFYMLHDDYHLFMTNSFLDNGLSVRCIKD